MDFPTYLLLGLFVLALAYVWRATRRPGGDPRNDRSYDPQPGKRVAHLWGYDDTRFEFCGTDAVRVTGSRYPLAGPPLPKFLPFVADVLGVPLTPELLVEPSPPRELPAPIENAAFSAALAGVFAPAQLGASAGERLEHSHGQLSVDEIYRIVQGGMPPRVVDLVVYPNEEEQVVELVKLAAVHNVVLIPYGGGTNVSGALLCPANEQRMVVSVDMRSLNRIVAIDRDNRLATVQSGITGKDLEALLEAEGFTCGHVPDSMEFSTLGGWIATNASGMKKNRYGNIEDIVREAVLVTPRGEMRAHGVNPRSSVGVAPRNLLFGSEGSLGIITRAVLQIHPLPEVRQFASFIFKDFAAGTGFMKLVQESGARPASLRLANNTEFRLGRALSPASHGWHHLVGRLKQHYVVNLRKFDPLKMVICTTVMEGSAAEVRLQQDCLARLAKQAGGMAAGPEAGKRGYRVTFAIAYIRDFLNKLGVLGETFETSAPWDRVAAITSSVERELLDLCRSHGVVGRPYLSYRISQVYQAGVCIYFTMGFFGRGMADAEKVYHQIEHRLREVILEQGGSLSHHHGVGKVRQDFMGRVQTPLASEAVRAVKQALDPQNVFAAGNNVFGAEPAGEHAAR